MAQNFDVTPYNDDFNETKHFYRVLFRPKVAVQARELTQAQTILQQQIKYFGDSIYKHGSMVIPGSIATDPNTSYVRLAPTYGTIGNTPIPINLNYFTNQIIHGGTTGLEAQVVFSVAAEGNDPPTLFVKYTNTGTNGEKVFVVNELLTIKDTTTVLAQTASTSPCGLGISAQIGEGVYYVFGFFARVEAQYLILSKYNNITSTRVGLQITESIVTSDDDPSLLDNAQGSTNYAAPGAHRYKLDLTLAQKPIDSADDENFVELVRLVNSITQKKIVTDSYSVIDKQMATRMSDASGDFVVRNFSIDVREHLDTSFVTKDKAVAAAKAVSPNPATISLATSASAITDFYKNMTLYITDGAGAGQSFTITGYNGSTKVAVLDDDFKANQVADATSVYRITDPTKINRGIYPPSPFGNGDASKLAVGLESGRAYVDGYLVDTLVTNYVPVDKARDFAQAVGSVIPASVGNYILVKNLFNIPVPAASANKDFLTIAFSNHKANGSFNASQNQIGTARVHTIEFYQGLSPADPNAVFKMYVFDVQMNVGQTITTARSFFLSNDTTNNNNGNSLNAYGDICAELSVSSVNGTGLVQGHTITGPSGVGTEVIVSYDPINNLLLTEPNYTNVTQILTTGAITTTGTTAVLNSRVQLFETANSILLYPLSQQIVKTVRGADTTTHTSYYIRQMFEAQRNGSGQYIFSTGPTTPFASQTGSEYLACIVYSPTSGEIGKFIDLSSQIASGSFSGSPANTTLTIQITSGLGSAAGTIIKLMATVIRTAVGEKLKALTTTQVAFPNPTATMSLNKADIYSIDKIIDSGSPSVNADPTNPAHIDIKNRYYFDNGQRDSYYDIGAVTLIPGAPNPAGRVLIVFKYFAHSGAGDYFSVDSYTNQLDYTLIPTYLGSDGRYYPLRDHLDFRPRKSDSGINFSNSGASFSAPVKPNTVVQADFQYYLKRIDKIYLDQYGTFNVIRGTSALNPTPPADPNDGMMLYTLSLNPYTLSVKDMTIASTNNRRYTMHDIGKLDQRISNLEYYTSLNLLEQKTQTMQITDTKTGLDRFKNGFVVDNFTGHNVGNVFDGDYKCSVDAKEGTLRPPFVQDSNSLVFNNAASSGYVQRSSVLMMPYTHSSFIDQKFATASVNINPFAVFTWYGDITLDPATDAWKDTVQRPVITVTDDKALDGVKYLNQWSDVTWGDWQQSWVGDPVTTTTNVGPTVQDVGTWTNGAGNVLKIIQVGNGRYTPTGPEYDGQQSFQIDVGGTTVTTTQQVGQVRQGVQKENITQTTQQIDNRIVDRSTVPYIRSRRVKVIGRHFKPYSRIYPFFDGVDVSAFCRPFSDPDITPTLAQNTWTTENITWGGDYSPEAGSLYGGVSTTGDTGKTGSFAVGPLNAPLMTDREGTTTLFFEIPCDSTNKFRIGTRLFRLTDSATNANDSDTYGTGKYVAAGIIEQNQETITSILTPVTITKDVTDTTTTTNTTTTSTGDQKLTVWLDPLAQSILIKQAGGAYISKIDLFFAQADPVVPVTLQIRSMVNGYPSQNVVPFSEKTLYPNNALLSSLTASGDIPTNAQTLTDAVINVSDDASVPTTFEFDAPVYLNDGTEYAIVLISNSVQYKVYVAVLGGIVVGSTSVVSKTPYLGSLFKSQNASTWVADPTSNMKFTIYRAKFDPTNTGVLYFTNSAVQPDILGSIPFQTLSGSNIVRVLHGDHQMPKGQYVNSVVTLSNIAPGTYNGLTDTQLTGTFSINNVDLDSYTIVVPGTAATSTGRVGPDGIVATKNRQYDSLCPVASQLTPTGSSVQWGIKTTTGKSPHNNSITAQEPYIKDQSFTQLPVNTTSTFIAPCMIASDINETTSIVGSSAFDRKSLVMQGIMATTQDNLSPLVDSSRVGAITINSRIDDPSFANETIDVMDVTGTLTSTSNAPFVFNSQIILTLVGVTGGVYTTSDTVVGAVSGATGQVVSWDSVNLVLQNATGTFQTTEAVSGASAIGTVQSIQTVNTITDSSSTLDFSIFKPGYSMTIVGSPSNQYLFSNPVVVLAVGVNSLTVDTGAGAPFVPATNQTNVVLTQYNRFVAESGPHRCTAAARYITRQFTLAQPATSLHVYFTINRPPGSFVDCYYRVLKANRQDDLNGIVWSLLPLDSTVDSGVSSNRTEFKEYVYTADNIGAFTAFSIKLVMRGGNSAQVPRIQDFRAIALAT
jgi:hypothetical protein